MSIFSKERRLPNTGEGFNRETDLVWAWIDSCCYVAEGATTKAVDTWRAYKQWSQDCSIKTLPRETFYRRLSEGFCISVPPRRVHSLVLKPVDDWDYWDVEDVRKVYFLSDGQAVKIGVSQDPETRLKGVQVGSSRAVVLLGWIPGGFELETEIHERFKDRRGEGEWFYLTPSEVKELIDDGKGCFCRLFEDHGRSEPSSDQNPWSSS